MALAQVGRMVRKARSLGFAKAFVLARERSSRELFRRLGRLRAVPDTIFVELTNKCNLHCAFCDRQGLTRGLGTMSMDLFKKIIDNAAQIGVRNVKLNRFGEPLLHPNLPEMIRYCKEKGILRVSFTSNATLLTEETSRQLILAGLDMISFSIDGATKETFEKVRAGANFEKVKENILTFIRLRNSMGNIAPWIIITAGFSADTREEIFDVLATWCPRVDEVHVHPVVKYGNVEDMSPVKRADGISKRRACPDVFMRLILFWDGTATVCCADPNGDLAVGNVKDSRIEDLWRNERFSEIRKKHARLDIASLPLCMRCDATDVVHQQKVQAEVRLVEKEAAARGCGL